MVEQENNKTTTTTTTTTWIKEKHDLLVTVLDLNKRREGEVV